MTSTEFIGYFEQTDDMYETLMEPFKVKQSHYEKVNLMTQEEKTNACFVAAQEEISLPDKVETIRNWLKGFGVSMLPETKLQQLLSALFGASEIKQIKDGVKISCPNFFWRGSAPQYRIICVELQKTIAEFISELLNGKLSDRDFFLLIYSRMKVHVTYWQMWVRATETITLTCSRV